MHYSAGPTCPALQVLLSDLSYSAFIVPISIGMWTSFYKPNWTTISDFLFGEARAVCVCGWLGSPLGLCS